MMIDSPLTLPAAPRNPHAPDPFTSAPAAKAKLRRLREQADDAHGAATVARQRADAARALRDAAKDIFDRANDPKWRVPSHRGPDMWFDSLSGRQPADFARVEITVPA